MAHEFGIGLEELDDAEWFLCTPDVLRKHAQLASAIAEFEAAAGTNPEAADEAPEWLLTDSLQGNRALTLDPRDSLTQEMWLKQGFRRTDTELDGGLSRLYAPVFGPYWGSLERRSKR